MANCRISYTCSAHLYFNCQCRDLHQGVGLSYVGDLIFDPSIRWVLFHCVSLKCRPDLLSALASRYQIFLSANLAIIIGIYREMNIDLCALA